MVSNPGTAVQVLYVATQLLALAGLVAVAFFALRAAIRLVLRRPQGRLGRRILLSIAVYLCGAVGTYGILYAYILPKPPELSNHPGTLTKLGQHSPDFEITTLEGESIRSADLRGKVVVLSFFATWCGPCLMEMPRLEKELWQPHRGDRSLCMLCIGREETAVKLVAFRGAHGFTLPMAADPHRGVYDRFATQSIPRTYVIDRNGVIVYQSTGYRDDEIRKLLRVVRQQLARAR